MTPDINDKFAFVALGTKTELASPGYSIGADTITCEDLSAWAAAGASTAVFFGIDRVEVVDNKEQRVAGTYTEWKGIVSGDTIGSLELLEGTDQNYAADGNTRVYMVITSAWANALIEGILASHNQDGTLKTNSVGTAQVVANSIGESEINFADMKPHQNTLYFSDGATGQVFGASEATLNFTASDSNGYGITATTGSGAYLAIARAGKYEINFQAVCVDVTATGFIVWFEVSTDNGASWVRIRQTDRVVNDDTAQLYSKAHYLPAGARVRATIYNGGGNTRFGAVVNTNEFTKIWTGTHLSVSELGRSVD